MEEYHSLGIFEAGISVPDEMARLEKIIRPSIGIFTNLGTAHAEGFRNAQHKIQEKLKLFAQSEVVIYCKDQPVVAEEIEKLFCHHTLSWGHKCRIGHSDYRHKE